MTETNVEKIISRIRRILCDWGIAKPTAPKNGVFYGNTAPLWRCPTPVLLLICSILHFLIFITEIAVTGYVQKLSGSCSSNVITTRNFCIFLFFFSGAVQFYISRSEIGTDKQWCRYITISIILECILFLVSLALGFLVASGCKSQDISTYNIAVSIALLGIISSACFAGVIIYTIVKLYCLGNPLAYNQEV